MSTYNLLIITPNGKVFDDQIEALTAPGSEGYFGVLAHHAPMVALLKKGLLKIKKDASELFFNIESGILEVSSLDHNVLILADQSQKI